MDDLSDSPGKKARFAVIGAGGVGGLLGGLLYEAGNDITFVARGRTLAALQQAGLHVETLGRSFHIPRVSVLDNVRRLSGSMPAIIAVKGSQLPSIANDLAAADEFSGPVVPLLNGISAPAILAESIGADRIIGGLCHMISEIVSPGVIRHWAYPASVQVGELTNGVSERTADLAHALTAAGIWTSVEPDINAALWHKLALIGSWGAACAAAGTLLGKMRESDTGRRTIASLVREILAIGCAIGVSIAPDAEQTIMRTIWRLPDHATSSLQRDLDAGLPSELEELFAPALNHARESSTDVPELTAIYESLLARDNSNRASCRPGNREREFA